MYRLVNRQSRNAYHYSTRIRHASAVATQIKPSPVESVSAVQVIENAVQNGAEDAFYVVDLQDVKNKYTDWIEALPRVEPFFAVKCNDDDRIVSLLAELGAGFDCASKGEIAAVQAHGVPSDKIIYANPYKQPSHLQYAAETGVDMLTFDSLDELIKISQLHPTAQLLLRIQVDDSHSVCKMGAKFGAHMHDVPALLQSAVDLGVTLRGVSYHVGSGCYSDDSFVEAAIAARTVFDLAHSYGIEFDILDIGGGFSSSGSGSGTANNSGDDQVTFESTAAKLRPVLDSCFPDDGRLRIMAEPGRYFVRSSHSLAVNIIGRKMESAPSSSSLASPLASDASEVFDEDAQRNVHYYVNDGIYGSFNCLMYDHAEVHPKVLSSPTTTAASTLNSNNSNISNSSPSASSNNKMLASSLWGHSCDGLDCIMQEVNLPLLEPGQWLLFEDMGAYTVSAASTFNGFPVPKKLYISTHE